MRTMLSDLVTVGRRFRRSVRIGADAGAADVEGFVCTATASQALETTVDHVSRLGHSAFTWTGPYGCGKSTLAVILAAALGRPGPVRDQALETPPVPLRTSLVDAMRWKAPGWRVVPVVGRRGDPVAVVREALSDWRDDADPVRALIG